MKQYPSEEVTSIIKLVSQLEKLFLNTSAYALRDCADERRYGGNRFPQIIDLPSSPLLLGSSASVEGSSAPPSDGSSVSFSDPSMFDELSSSAEAGCSDGGISSTGFGSLGGSASSVGRA